MRKFFKAIRDKDLELVRQLVEAKPALVNCVAKQPPKKDDGQSPLQVALKTGSFDIADFLIDGGADLNFIEDASCCNIWRAPVIHDAINAAVMNCRWNSNNKYTGFKTFSSESEAQRAYDILAKMLSRGANVNALDSHGNSGIWRFCLQAAQILPTYNYREGRELDDHILTDELQADLRRILELLCASGADLNYVSPNMKRTVREFYVYGAMARVLEEAHGA